VAVVEAKPGQPNYNCVVLLFPAELPGKQQACIPSAPYKAKPKPRGPQTVQNAPKSLKLSAKQAGCQNLTLMHIHQTLSSRWSIISQPKHQEPFSFDATTLGQKAKKHPELESHTKSHPNALSTKHPYAVV
jgi:hypothetical protein